MLYTLTDINESYTELETEDINFKKRVIDTLSVFEEGYQFNPLFRSQMWDGKRHFSEVQRNKNIRFPKGLVEYIIKDLKSQNLEYSYTKITENYILDFKEFKSFVDSLELPFEPYDYQVQASYDMVVNRRGVFQAATSSGKSLILYIFISFMLKNNKKTILVVPSISLTLQMKSDFIDYNMEKHYNIDDTIKLIGGEFNNKDLSSHNLVISTWQSLQYLGPSEFDIFDTICIDEAHSAKSEVLSNITKSAINAKWKIGVTGTVPRTMVAKLELLGTLGKVFKVITPQGLIERGLATPVYINLLYFNYSYDDKLYVKKNRLKYPEEEKYIVEHYDRNRKVASIMNKVIKANNGENVLTLFTKVEHGKNILRNTINLKTNNTNFELLDKITPKPVSLAIESWTLDTTKIFYTNESLDDVKYKKIFNVAKKILSKEDSEAFLKSIKSLTDLNIYFIYGGVEGTAREYIRKILEESPKVTLNFSNEKISLYKNYAVPLSNNKTKEAYRLTPDDTIDNNFLKKHNIKEDSTITDIFKDEGTQIIASYGTTSTGSNFRNLHHLVLAASTKSFIRLSQSIGRGMRKHDTKAKVHIWDIIDDISWETNKTKKENYALKHSYERIEIYRENGYPISEKEIKLI